MPSVVFRTIKTPTQEDILDIAGYLCVVLCPIRNKITSSSDRNYGDDHLFWVEYQGRFWLNSESSYNIGEGNNYWLHKWGSNNNIWYVNSRYVSVDWLLPCLAARFPDLISPEPNSDIAMIPILVQKDKA